MSTGEAYALAGPGDSSSRKREKQYGDRLQRLDVVGIRPAINFHVQNPIRPDEFVDRPGDVLPANFSVGVVRRIDVSQ